MIDKFTGDYHFLSNFYLVDVLHEDVMYPSAEHAFVAMKTLDLDERDRIAAIQTPGKAKRYGHELKLRPEWDEIRLAIMHEVVENKFYQNRLLAVQLMDTTPHELVEGNQWHDSFWGKHWQIGGPRVGANWLGRILMMVRSTFYLEEA